ncbi:hypothetical protein EPUS_02335 [Endocarpon pusillum Z07020]|uniref:Uncharacterized protein n=1 Tax=Endocarpon pusillum (strain Z07020 / HMAS-L-300199) TaxID=1263415 RepID=U1GFD5_ENDPU|nr:uncharacterized protein EPUS_02335 [Endocarpon pusillum Z07020]ERF70813.1 hypothetical protein EPUS_02335 [Endocarpon pusillum Z07020]
MSAHKISTAPRTTSDETRREATSMEGLSENDGAVGIDISPAQGIEDIVGFSIGQEQLRMKSADTPAFEKAKVLNQSKDYFDLEPEDGEQKEGDASLHTYQDLQIGSNLMHGTLAGEAFKSPNHQPSSIGPSVEEASRLNNTRSIMKDAFGSRIRRASSESSGMVDALKKLLPELPSISLPRAPGLASFGFGSKSKTVHQLNASKRSSTLFSSSNLPWVSLGHPPDPAVAVAQANQSLHKQNDSAFASLLHSHENLPLGSWQQHLLSPRATPKQRSLRRATSESSIFMRNDLDRTTTQDDAEKWTNVSEQINSRFKAITDSFQDSALSRMPKMPSVSLSSLKPGGIQRNNSDDTKFDSHHTNASVQRSSATNKPGIANTNASSGKQAKHAHPILNEAVSDLAGDVVVLGGYRGSILRSAKPPHKQLWVPVKVGMNLRRVDLEVGLNPEDEERMKETIVPSGVLSHIGPVDICRRLLRHLKRSARDRPDQLRIHNYGYDWRLSPDLLSQQLIQFLESLQCNKKDITGRQRGAVVIAHSLGGAITRHAVNQRPDLFAGVLYAGVPQHCINILGPLRNGDDVLLSSRVLTAQVNFTLRTSYALLPESGKCFISKTTGERYDVDFFDVKTWEDYCLSPCIAATPPVARPEQRKSIIGALSDSLPSLPLSNKRNSISRRADSPSPEAPVSLEDAKEAIKESANHTAQKAEEAFASPNTQPLEPSMGSLPPAATKDTVATACTLPRAEALAYLERTLRSVRQFKQELAFNPSHHSADVYPPMAVLYSDSVPTVFAARVDSREAIKRADAYDNLAFAAGDGVVLSRSARPPEGYKIVKGGLVKTDRGHIGLLGDLEAVGKCLRAISDARRRGVGTGIFAKKGA